MTDSNLTAPPPLLPRVEFNQLRGVRQNLFANLLKRAQIGSLTVQLPGGGMIRQHGEGDAPRAVVTFRTDGALAKLFTGGHNGFAEAYLSGDLDIDDPTALFTWFLANEPFIKGGTQGSWLSRAMHRVAHLLRPNTKRGSRKNISAHYDLGNGFYQEWLDETMSYSSGIFSSPDQPLKHAQDAKNKRILDTLGVKAGDSLLEIGCGWGGLLEMAHRDYGVHARGVTISSEQLSFAKARLSALGADNAVHFEDYRDTEGQFDFIASVEMFEAVGEKNWSTYFQAVHDRLKPGGQALIQVITIDHDRYLVYRDGADFIQRYIFPGGMLPSPQRFEEEACAAGLSVDDVFTFGKSYAETLRRWRDVFEDRFDDHIAPQGFDARFRRLWRYYLTYCEAGFDFGSIDVAHYLLKKTGE